MGSCAGTASGHGQRGRRWPRLDQCRVAEGTLGEEPRAVLCPLGRLDQGCGPRVARRADCALDATRQEPAEVRIVGEYAGPLPLLAVIVGVVAHFL